MSNTLTVTEVVNSVTVTPVENTVEITTGISAGSTTTAGILQLTDSVSSTSTTTAATPNAVKTAYDLAAIKTPVLAIPSTYYITTPYASHTNIAATQSRTNYIPIYVPVTTSFDRIAILTGTNLSGTATIRMGIYANDTATGKPSTLILDAGTVTASTINTIVQITISQSLSAGFYWLAMNTQTAAAVNAYTGIANATNLVNNLMPYKSSPTANFATGWREENITGAFTTAGTLLQLGSSPNVWLRAA